MRRTRVGQAQRGGLASLAALVCLALALVAALPSTPSDASPGIGGPVFDCQLLEKHFLSQGGELKVRQYGEGVPDTYVPVNPAADTSVNYNATGFNPIDRYIYAVRPSDDHLLQVDADADVHDTGVTVPGVTGSFIDTGAFDETGLYYLKIEPGGGVEPTLLRLNVPSGTPVGSATTLSSVFPPNDWTFTGTGANRRLWGLDDTTLYRVDPASGQVSAFSAPSGVTSMQPPLYGAAWTFGNGDVGFAHNATGDTHQIRITNPTAAAPAFTLVATRQADPSSQNDGTSCIGADVDLRITKTAPATVSPGGVITWTITVHNNGPGTASAFTIEDSLSGAAFNTGAPPAGCSLTTTHMTCNLAELASGADRVITLTANAPAAGSCATNSATVDGQQNDPVTANDTTGNVLTCTVAAGTPTLAIEKTHAGGQTFVAGGSGNFTAVISNTGTASTSGTVNFDDTLPTGLVPNGAPSGTGWLCDPPAGSAVHCDRANALPAGQRYPQITIPFSIGASVTGLITNTACASGGGDQGPTVCDPDSITVGALAAPDLTLTKNAPAHFVRGSNAVYTLTVSNDGTGQANAPITVTDTLPAGLTFVSGGGGSSGWACGAVGQVVTCTRFTALPSGSATPFTLTVAVGLAAPASITNCATVSGNGEPEPTANNGACDTSTVVDVIDLSVTKNVNVATARPGDAVTYTIVVHNSGPSAATGVTLDETVPPGITVTSVQTSAGTCFVPSGDCFFPPLGAGEDVTVTVTGVAQAAFVHTDQTNAADVSAGNIASDTDRGNEHATATVRIVAPDLRVTKSTTGPLVRGTDVTYTLTVSNAGEAPANPPILVTDTLPDGLSFVSGGGPGGACSAVDATVTCPGSAGALAPLATAQITLVAHVALDAPASIENCATVAGNGEAEVPHNNQDCITNTVTDVIDLSVTKTVAAPTVRAGSDATYTVTVHNSGPSDATGVTLDETLPAGIELQSVTPAPGASATCDAVGDCALTSPLGPGASVVFTVLGRAQLAQHDSDQVNQAHVSATNIAADSDRSNEEDSATVRIVAPDLTIAKTTTATELVRGTDVAYTLAVSNIGSASANPNLTVTDNLPTGLSFVSASGGGWSCGSAPPVVTCTHAGLAAGTAAAAITLTVHVALNAPATIQNCATVAGNGDAEVPGNNQDCISKNVTDVIDLSVTKTVAAPTVRAGQDATYTITVHNDGPSNANGVTLDETLPTGIVLQSVTPALLGSATCNAAGDCTLSNPLGPGASLVFTVIGRAQLAQHDTDQVNDADVTATNIAFDTDRSNEHDSATVRIVAPDLTITKTTTATALVRGTDVTYTLAVSNIGSATANANLTVTDTLPAGLSFVSASGGGWSCGSTPPVVTCTHTSLAPGTAAAAIRLTVHVALNAPATIQNCATVAGNGEAEVPDNNQDCVTRPTKDEVDMTITKVASPTKILATQRTTFTIVVTNTGPSIAHGVVMTDLVAQTTPNANTFTPISATTTKGTCTTPSYTCALGEMDPQTSVTITIVAEANNTKPPAESTQRNTARVATTPASEETNTANDSATADVTVDRTNDLLATKLLLETEAVAGAPVTFRIRVLNTGPSDALNSTVTDTLPAMLKAPLTAEVDPATGAGTCTFDSPETEMTCELPSILEGDAVDILLTGTLESDSAGEQLENTACAANPNDPKTANNCDTTAQVEIIARSDIIVTLDGPARVKAGAEIAYDATIRNAGPSDAPGTQLIVDLPGGTSFVTIDPATDRVARSAPGCAEGSAVTCSLGVMTAGAQRGYRLVARTTLSQAEQRLTAVALGSADPPDPTPQNNRAEVVTVVDPASDLKIVKTGPATVPAEQAATYTLTVSNGGPSASPNTIVQDAMPASMTLMSAVPSQGACGMNEALLRCELGTIAAGAGATIQVTAIPALGLANTTVPNTATVSGPHDDPDAANNASTHALRITDALPDLRLRKRLLTGTPRVGKTIKYVITATNVGHGPATGVIVIDRLPAALKFATVRSSAGTCRGKQVQTCAVGTIGPGAKVTITLWATVVAKGSVTNTAQATQNERDLNPDDSVAAITIGSSAAHAILRKRADSKTAQRGGPLRYTITFRNPGPGPLHDVKVCDDLPSAVIYRSASPKPFLERGKVCWRTRSLSAGASRTFHIRVRVVRDARGTSITNRAVATGPEITIQRAASKARLARGGVLGTGVGGGVTG